MGMKYHQPLTRTHRTGLRISVMIFSLLRSAQSPHDGSPYIYWRNPGCSLSLYLTSLRVWPLSIHTRIATVNAGYGGKLNKYGASDLRRTRIESDICISIE